MTEALASLLYLAAGILAWAGGAKAIRPGPTARALLAAGLPSSFPVVRTVAAWEIAVGLVCLVRPSPGAALALAATYGVFAAYLTWLLLTKPAGGSCGCAGERDVPPSSLHVALDLAAVMVGVAAATAHLPSLAHLLAGLGWLSIPFLGGAMAAGYLAFAAAALVPAAFASYTAPVHRHHRASGNRHLRADDVLAGAGVGPGHRSLWGGHGPGGG